jgi:histidinol dehydrogenase
LNRNALPLFLPVPVRTLETSSRSFPSRFSALLAASAPPAAVTRSVAAILGAIREGGDAAVGRYIAKFDGARLRPSQFRLPAAEARAALERLPVAEREAMERALASIRAFNQRGLPKAWTARNPDGARVGERHHPIRRVGLYIPGGQVPLVSTALMTAVLARIAGCPEVAVFTPSDPQGRVADGLLAALALADVDEIYRVGGVQAVGAMAFGTRTIPAVDKIFGPGNAYVCEAKRQVFGVVGVDSLPGPSELMIIADASADPAFAASDLLAQAEHGSGRERVFLVSPVAETLTAVAAEVRVQLRSLGRRDRIAPVLHRGFVAVRTKDLEEAAQVANRVAPEHLELLVDRSRWEDLLARITTAGAIMLGNHTPTALGDFVAGPSHVLPTGGTGRFLSGLRVADFMRRTSVVEYDRAALVRAEPVVTAFAAMERLDAHGRSVALRRA